LVIPLRSQSRSNHVHMKRAAVASAAKAAVARLIGTDGTQEVNLAKCRP
jgi:hypothetical protein